MLTILASIFGFVSCAAFMGNGSILSVTVNGIIGAVICGYICSVYEINLLIKGVHPINKLINLIKQWWDLPTAN